MRSLTGGVALAAVTFAAAAGDASPRFVQVDPAAFAGISSMELPGGGVAFTDLDGDGHDDVVAVRSGAGIEVRHTDVGAWRLRAPGPSPAPAGASNGWQAMSVAPADVDGDGRVDLLLGATNGAHLLVGRAGGGFDDRTALAFDGLSRPVSAFAVADVDGDGWLDVHLVTYMLGADWPHVRCAADALFLQREGGWVRAELPDASHGAGCGFGAVWFDQDGDGDPDAWVANDFGPFVAPSHVWRNDGIDAAGRLLLRDASDAISRPIATYAMGVAVGDVDADGLLDVASSSIGRAPLHRALGGGRFDDQAEAFGTAGSLGWSGTRMTWGVVLADLDGDGATDLFEAGGYYPLDPLLRAHPGGSPTLFYAGGEAPWREDASAFIEHTRGGDYRGVAVGDLDGDGAPDLALAGAMGTDPLVLRNVSPGGGPWLDVVPLGTVSPREARGAVVTLTCRDGVRRTAVVPTGGNPGSMSAPRAFLSLAGCDRARSTLQVAWPSGVRSTHPIPGGAGLGTLVVDEPRWLTVDRPALLLGGHPDAARATVAVVPRDEHGRPGAGHAVAILPITEGASAGPTVVDEGGIWRATVSARVEGDAWFAIVVDGRTMPRRVRLPVRGRLPTTTFRVTPVAIAPSRSVEVAVVPRRPDGVAWGPGRRFTVVFDGASGATIADDRGGGCYVARASLVPGRTAPVGVFVTAPDGAVSEVRVPVVGDVDRSRTVAELRPALALSTAPPSAPGSLYVALYTPLGDPFVGRAGALPRVLDVRGEDLGPARSAGPTALTFALDDGHAGAGPFSVWFGADAVSAPVARRSFAARDALAAEVSAATSRLEPMLATLEADGVEATGLALRLADEHGQIIDLPDVQWDAEGGRIEGDSIPSMDGSVIRRVVVGTRPGVLRARVHVRDGLTLSTTITLVAPRAEPATALELCVSDSFMDGGAGYFQATVRPRAANGLLAGGNRDVTLTVDDFITTMTASHGSYTAHWNTDASSGTTRVRATDRGSLMPARPTDAIEATIEFPSRRPGDEHAASHGEVRCVTARVRGGQPDAGDRSPGGPTDASAGSTGVLSCDGSPSRSDHSPAAPCMAAACFALAALSRRARFHRWERRPSGVGVAGGRSHRPSPGR